MGFSHSVGLLTSLLFFLVSLLLFSFPRASLSLSTRPENAPSPLVSDRYRRGSHVMRPRPYPSDDDHMIQNSERRRRRKKTRGYHHDLGARTFSAMLPRGFVPPSDSSWRHNDAPDSINLLCDDKSTSRP
ncbi:hypothetical protein BHE74_00024303 [Ensete ventricosum]|nr:hypothetical protein GW17_00014748 [Ensete ventricosum]RWW68181.1 hypothetical protein BHE74_00024303 [Ensete ventricosum]